MQYSAQKKQGSLLIISCYGSLFLVFYLNFWLKDVLKNCLYNIAILLFNRQYTYTFHKWFYHELDEKTVLQLIRTKLKHTSIIYAATSTSSGGKGAFGCLFWKCCLNVFGSGIRAWKKKKFIIKDKKKQFLTCLLWL